MMKMRGCKENLEKVLLQASEDDWKDGMEAFLNYRDRIQRDIWELSFNEQSLEHQVASFAVLSPNNDEDGNFRDWRTLNLMLDGKIPLGQKFQSYPLNVKKARNILQIGFISKYLKGRKVRSFYNNLLNPLDPNPVTIDGHMKAIWIGERLPLKSLDVRKTEYEEISRLVKEIAKDHSLLPHQIQATLWFTWKRLNKIRWSPQRRLFS